ncbi:hypothetical protein J1614_009725 [Plenodomus biglobosus]|nr:hypothetical protein J1614_009725 [Plenodomus biglobosus]
MPVQHYVDTQMPWPAAAVESSACRLARDVADRREAGTEKADADRLTFEERGQRPLSCRECVKRWQGSWMPPAGVRDERGPSVVPRRPARGAPVS